MKFNLDLEVHDLKPRNISGIYFLLDELNEVVYIGKSIDIMSRIKSHEGTEKVFSRFAFIELPLNEQLIRDLESDFIAIYQPIYNKAMSSAIRYIECTKKTESMKSYYSRIVKIGEREYIDSFSRITGEDIINDLSKNNEHENN